MRKLLSILILVLLVASVFSFQFKNTALAADPLTPPITVPITVPVTSPAAFFTISGKVTYHFLGRLFAGMQRFIAVPNVTITARDVYTGHTVTTTSDLNGFYSLTLDQKGLYKITPTNPSTAQTHPFMFTPPLRFVNVTHQGSRANQNFQGLVFPRF